ncbi:response regulator [Cupriavidus sp. CP313]
MAAAAGEAGHGSPAAAVVDDDDVAAMHAVFLLRHLGIGSVCVHHSVAAAIAAIRASVPPLVICDIEMPGGGGVSVLRVLAERACPCRVLLCSGHDDRWQARVIRAARLTRLPDISFAQKPLQARVLRDWLAGAGPLGPRDLGC